MESMAKAGVAMAAGTAAMAAFLRSKPDSANLWATVARKGGVGKELEININT